MCNRDLGRTCDLESSTSIFAAGCSTVIFCKMVAPSLVMMTSPLGADTCAARGSTARLQTQPARRSICRHTHHLVHATRPQAGADSVCNRLGTLNVDGAHILALGALPAHRHINARPVITHAAAAHQRLAPAARMRTCRARPFCRHQQQRQERLVLLEAQQTFEVRSAPWVHELFTRRCRTIRQQQALTAADQTCCEAKLLLLRAEGRLEEV